jgi:hypothetical protein
LYDVDQKKLVTALEYDFIEAVTSVFIPEAEIVVSEIANILFQGGGRCFYLRD